MSQEKIDAEFAARKNDLVIARQQFQEFAAKTREAEMVALRIDGAIQQLQALGAKDPAPPVESAEETPAEVVE